MHPLIYEKGRRWPIVFSGYAFMPHIHEWFLLHILSLFMFLYPGPLSLPSQEVDCHGNVVQERVEQAMEEIKDRLAFLEKRGRAEVREKPCLFPCIVISAVFFFCSQWWKRLYTR